MSVFDNIIKTITGYDSATDLIDGGGKGGSGDTFSNLTNAEYIEKNKNKTKLETKNVNGKSVITEVPVSHDNNTTFWQKVKATNEEEIDTLISQGDTFKDADGNDLGEVSDRAYIDGKVVKLSSPISKRPEGVSDAEWLETSNAEIKEKTVSVIKDFSTDAVTSGDGAGDSGDETVVAEDEEEFDIGTKVLEWAKTSGQVQSDEDIKALLLDPMKWLRDRDLTMQDVDFDIDGKADGTNVDASAYDTLSDLDTGMAAQSSETIGADNVTTVDAVSYDASTIEGELGTDATTVNAASGTLTDNDLVDAAQIDTDAMATGETATGKALDAYASINMSTLIDTNTVAGKLLADKLTKEGKDFVDAKTSLVWQMKTIAGEFKDSAGNPIIPPWAQSISRSVNRQMAFGDITGTAAAAAMSNAIMEASIGVAEKEAVFFQDLTKENLSNRQEALINKATVLAGFEEANLTARQEAVVTNAKSFLQMSLKNLEYEQEGEVINTQEYIDVLLSDQSAINAERLFGAQETNKAKQFYDSLNADINMHRNDLITRLRTANTAELNDYSMWEKDLEDSRAKWYSEFQYEVDSDNAEWRRTVTEKNAEMKYDSYAEDVKNGFDLSQEGMNRIWDRIDSTLDFIFKGWDSESERDANILVATIQAQAGRKSGGNSLLDGIIDLTKTYVTSQILPPSDKRLKKNIQYEDTFKGHKYYTWEWNDEGIRVGANKYPGWGVIAQEVQRKNPKAVTEGPHGYLTVDYGALI